MKKFIGLFKKVGGKEILRQYSQAHVLLFALLTTALLGLKKKSLEIVRLAVNDRILCRMRKKYARLIDHYRAEISPNNSKKHSNTIWLLWLQGIENAPNLVKKCYQSMLDNLSDYNIVLLTEHNYRDYVEFPDYIQRKIDEGIITKTHMSDLLRLELLNRFGGTWIDATVYCSDTNIPEYMLKSDLFLFQNLKPGLDGQCTCISSWFITASTGNPILLMTQKLLYEYWKNNTKMTDYFLFHDFFQLSIEAYPEEWNKVIPFSNSTPHILLLRMFEQYDQKMWDAVKMQVPFHKLSYKYDLKLEQMGGTYYDILLR